MWSQCAACYFLFLVIYLLLSPYSHSALVSSSFVTLTLILSVSFNGIFFSPFPGGWWGCGPVTLDVSSVVLKGRSAVLNHCVLLQTSETISSHTTLCWLWPLSLKYTNTHSSVHSVSTYVLLIYPAACEVCNIFAFWLPLPDSSHWTKALPESLDDFSLQQGMHFSLLVQLLVNECKSAQIHWNNNRVNSVFVSV